MLLELTVSQLDVGSVPPDRAKELGQLGYMQRLGALPPMVGYRREAMRAYSVALPFTRTSSAVADFWDLLVASLPASR